MSLLKRKSGLALLLATSLLTACANTFAFRVQSSTPAEVGSIFVLFGNGDQFTGKEEVDDIINLLQKDSLKGYTGYTEHELELTGSGTNWTLLSDRLPPQISVDIETKTPGVIAYELDRELLELHEGLGIAVILRTTESDYVLRTWENSFLAQFEGTLIIDLTGSEIEASFKE